MSQIAQTILQQLGGQRFIVMTGSKNFAFDSKQPNYLSMHLARNKSGAQYLKITLNGLDLYDMQFTKFTGSELKTVKEVNNIYFDQLQEIFTQVTGLYTHL